MDPGLGTVGRGTGDMKILELGKYCAPGRGGIETLVQAWSEGFVRRGARVDCVVSHDRNEDAEEVRNGVWVHRCARRGEALSLPLCPGYLGAAKRYPADVWHGHFPNPLMDAACFLGSRKTPLVISYHSEIVRQARSAFLRSLAAMAFANIALHCNRVESPGTAFEGVAAPSVQG